MRTSLAGFCSALCVALFSSGCSLLVSEDLTCKSDSDCTHGAACQAGVCVLPAEDAGEADAGSDGGVIDAGDDAGAVDAGDDAGVVDAGQDGGVDAGPVCPATPDCTLPECAGAACATGAHCATAACRKDGTTCAIAPSTGAALCDDASCAGISCGNGAGTCTSLMACEHATKTGCVLNPVSGAPAACSAACQGLDCGTGKVCTDTACETCGATCGSAPAPGCSSAISCSGGTAGTCVSSCMCSGAVTDTYCAASSACQNLQTSLANCGLCARACLGNTCTSGCCGEPSDCLSAATASCAPPANAGYTCASTPSLRAQETNCGDGIDNDGDGQTDCADPDCLAKNCGGGAGTCSAQLTCEHKTMTGCTLDPVTGAAASCNAACLGVSCGSGKACGATACETCGATCGGTPAAGCSAAISCTGSTAGTCVTSCLCAGTATDTYCSPPGTCQNLLTSAAHCGSCSRACAGTTCSNGCCGEPGDCLSALTATCTPPVGAGYVCSSTPALRAQETDCGDGKDNDGDGLIDCADPDCNGLTCGVGRTCSDAVCCNTACSGGCDVCKLSLGATADGTCTVLTAGSAGSGCNGFLCNGTAAACPSTCVADANCAAGHYCSASGVCTLDLPQGSACTAGNQCASKQCSDGFCCNTACAGACDACSKALGATADGTCTILGNTAVGGCSPYLCDGANATCPVSCTLPSQCATGFTCLAGGACGKEPLGAACANGNLCVSGFCADSVCCNTACGPCGRCSTATGAAVNGTCEPRPVGTVVAACGNYLCNGTAVSCPTTCATSADCVAPATCNTTAGTCQ